MTPAPKQQKLSDILTRAGAHFVLLRKPGEQYRNDKGETVTAKGKEPIGLNWQKKPRTLAEAYEHLRKGRGNVGILGGDPSNNLIVLDFDGTAAEALAAWPELGQSIRIFRENAPDRLKVIVHVVGDLPPSAKRPQMEVLATGRQGVIAGVHFTGARVESAGDTILDVTADQVAALWQTLTGEELGASGHNHEDAGPPDAEAVQRSMGLVEKVLDLAGVKPTGWKVYNGEGRKVVLLSLIHI